MGRMTRAKAAEVTDKLHIDEDAVLNLPSENGDVHVKASPEAEDRMPLGEMENNSSKADDDESEGTEVKKCTRGRTAGKKGVKGEKSKTKLGASTASQPDIVEEGEVMAEDEEVAALSPASEAAADILAQDVPKGLRSTSNKENFEPREVTAAAVVQADTPPGSSPLLSADGFPGEEPSEKLSDPEPDVTEQQEIPATADPIGAMDALDEAVEKVSAELPDLQATPAKPKRSPVKPLQKEPSRELPGEQAKEEPKEQPKPLKKEKPAPVVRTTKAAQARISMAQAEKAGISKAPRPSTSGLARSTSIRQNMLSTSESANVPTSRQRVPSGGTKKPANAPAEQKEKKETVIPHSKPRRVSLSFPTPPPPPKSKKTPTQSTFQLPGEAVAAKLKAAREERSKRETEQAEKDGEKKPAFKARPVPAGLKKAPSVRQTNASAARLSTVNGKPAAASIAGSAHKWANSAASTTAAKRTSVLGAPLSASTNLKPSELKVAKRPSTALASTSARPSLAPAAAPAPAAGQRVPSGKGTAKGKEVFNRVAAAKEAAEKEKREKEEAAKKARAAAAERGRQASKDWAEKQRLRKLGIKPAVASRAEESVAIEEAAAPDNCVQDGGEQATEEPALAVAAA